MRSFVGLLGLKTDEIDIQKCSVQSLGEDQLRRIRTLGTVRAIVAYPDVVNRISCPAYR